MQDPLQNLLEQIANLTKFAEQQAAKSFTGPVDPAIERQLEGVEKMVAKLKEVTKQNLEEQYTTGDQSIRNFRQQPGLYTPHDKRLIQQCLDLGLNIAILRAGLTRARKQKGMDKPLGPNTQKSIQKRQKKFKGFGSDPKWKKL